MRKLLALLALMAMLIPAAHAAELSLPYAASTVLSVADLTAAQRDLAHFLYTPVFNGEAKITLPKGARYDDVSAAMEALMQDYPELFHLGRDYTIGYYSNRPEIATWVEPQYRLSPQDAADARAVLYAQAYLLADAAPDAVALHDRLCSLVTYGGDTELRHTAVGALLQGQATCEGYAQALTLLYRMAGIPCGVVVGEATDSAGVTERHSWNIANLNGPTLIDATWNDQNHLGLNTHWYFGLSAGQMGVDHTPDADQRIPPCSDQANWHRVNGQIITTQAEADAALRRLVDGESLNLRITDAALYAALAQDTYGYLGGYNERHPEHAFYGAYSVTASDAQMCVILQRVE